MSPWSWIDRYHVLSLATTGPDGPWCAAVYYARDGERLVFLSSARSRHARNLAADPRCAATINGDAPDWASIRGVQLCGRARRLEGDQAEAARAIYLERFSDVLARADDSVRAALERIDWFALSLERALFIDNSRGFGHRQEFL